MYWPHEHSVTAVEASKVCSTNTLEIGSDCEVVIADKKYEGKISAKGKYIKKLPYIYSYNAFRDKSLDGKVG